MCSCVCIAKFLAFVLSPTSRSISYEDRRLINIRNYVFSLGFPVIMIPFHYLYSPTRFGLVRTMGCEASYVLTWPAFFFFIIWSPIFGIIAAAYTAYVGWKLCRWKWGRGSRNKSTKLPALRLAWLCISYTTVAVPLSIYYLIELLLSGKYSYFSVEKIRSNAGQIEYEPEKLKPTFYDTLPLFGSGIYIIFFTFSAELRAVYSLLFWKTYNFFPRFACRVARIIKHRRKLFGSESHTPLPVDVNLEAQMTELDERTEPLVKSNRSSVRGTHTTDSPASTSSQGFRYEDVRVSIRSSEQTLCSSPNATTDLIPR